MFNYNSKTKKYDSISYRERMTDSAHRIKFKVPVSTEYRLQHVQMLDEKTERVVYTSKVVPIDRVAEMKRYKVSDFALENLIATGSLSALKSVTLSKNPTDLVDTLISQMPTDKK